MRHLREKGEVEQERLLQGDICTPLLPCSLQEGKIPPSGKQLKLQYDYNVTFFIIKKYKSELFLISLEY